MPFIKNVGIFAKKTTTTPSTPVSEVGPFVAAGYDNTLVISPTGSVFGWGNLGNGQIGNPSFNFTCQKTPVSIGGQKKTFCKISLAYYHGHGIDKSGGLWGWGNSYYGGIGDGTQFQNVTTPKKIGTKTFCNIAGGRTQGLHSLAIDKNGKLWSWGYNLYGNLGTNNTTNYCTPVAVGGSTKTFCRVAAGQYHSAAIDKNGKVWSWGYNVYGQLGTGNTTNYSTPIALTGATKTFCEIVCGDQNTMAIDKNGKVWGWGYGYNFVFGNNGSNAYRTPVAVCGSTKTFCKISVNFYNTLAIDKNGKAWSWGYNDNGQMGIANFYQNSSGTPRSIHGTKTFCYISNGFRHAVARDKNNKFWAWGNDEVGQVGQNANYDVSTPISIKATNKTFCKITAGGGNTPLLIDKNKVIWGWGDGPAVGDGGTSRRLSPVSAYNPLNISFNEISSGQDFSLGLATTGIIYGWGYPNYGVTGHGNYTYYPYYSVTNMATFCKIAAGNYHSLAIDNNGKAWSWGGNWEGQLGQNIAPDYNARSVPGSVAGAAKTFCEIAAGRNNQSMAIDKNGKAWGWGNNTFGALGSNNGISSYCTPISVYGSKTFCKITIGQGWANAIDKNGQGWSWGYGGGVLGDNSQYITIATPVAICGNKTFCKISAGASHVAAIDKNGKVWAWGQNNKGQLGTNDVMGRLTPVSIYGTKTFCEIKCAYEYTFGIDKNGKAWGWGAWQWTDSNPIYLTPVALYGGL